MTTTSDNRSQFADTWELAVKRYASVVGKQPNDDSLPHLSSLEELLNQLDYQNKSFGRFRESKKLLFQVLTSICGPIQRFGSIAAGVASYAFAPSTICFNAIAYLIGAAKDDFLVRFSVYDSSHMSDALQAKVVDILATLLEIFGQATKIIRGGLSGRVLRFTKNALLGSDKTLQGLVSRLDKLCQTEHQLVGAETLVESQKTHQAVENLAAVFNGASLVLHDNHGKLAQTQADLQRLVESQDEFRQEMQQDMSSLLGSLMGSSARASSDSDHLKTILQPSVAPSDIYHDFARKRLQGTGEWILREPYFQNWLDGEQPLLWISGQPGCGKSFLAEYIITELKNRYLQGVDDDSQTSIGYFFFKDNNPKTRDMHQALRDIAYQISLNDSAYASEMALRCKSSSDVGTLQSAWFSLFRDYFVGDNEQNRCAYIVLDGLDECLEAERQMFLELLLDLKAEETGIKPRIQIVMIGRPHLSGDVVDLLHESVSSISIDRSKNDDDIARYVERSVMRSRNLARAPQSLRKEIIDFLTKNAQGMFLWVNLMVQELGRHNRASSIRGCLKQPPKGLYEAMRHTLECLSAYLKGDEPNELNTILAWVTCAARPLSLGELEAALLLESSEEDDILDLESMLRLHFASFVTLIREDGYTTFDLEGEVDSLPRGTDDEFDEGADDLRLEGDFNSNPETTEVVFCHASIGDFFRDQKESKCSAGEDYVPLGVDIAESRLLTLKACLQLVCSPTKSPNLRKYARSWWHSHVEAAASDLDQIGEPDRLEVATLLLKVLRDETILDDWLCQWDANTFWTLKTLDSIVRFLDNNQSLDTLALETREWVLATIQQPAKLLIPAGKAFAKQWLQDTMWDTRPCMLIINRIRNVLCGNAGENVNENLSASDVLDSAEWAGFPKTAEWYRRVAMCLRDLSFFDEAQTHFEAALELDSQMWLARSGLAYLYSLNEQHDKALDLYKTNAGIVEAALENVEIRDKLPHSVSEEDLADIYKDIGEEAVALDDAGTALEYFEKSLHLNAQSECSASYVEILGSNGSPEDNEKIILHLKRVEGVAESDTGHTGLTKLLSEKSGVAWTDPFYKAIASAARSTGQLEWLKDRYAVAIDVAKSQRDSVSAFSLQVSLSDLFISYDNKEDRAVEIWQMVMDFPATFMQGDMLMLSLQTLVSRRYGSYLLSKAIEAGPGTADAEYYIQILQRIAKRRVVHLDNVSQWAANNFAPAILGFWYHRNNQHEEARECCLPFVKQFVLSDDKENPIDSYFAYYAFAKILLAMGEEFRAIALLHRASLLEQIAWSCEGRCGLEPVNWTHANLCLECTTDICDNCLGLVKEQQPMKVNVCSPDHSWVRIPTQTVTPGPDELYVGDQAISMKDFKDQIKKEWGIN
ncbi:NACHT and TPR domain protein [Aspergillus ellipticus CBS 707.79]|uniref:NACHT and TPR domain protein n=1 Tax=Aspergillus ellipticus CBS 707.79 TaxID=1448320 RepID=A0A319D7U2_9EURO|nr:NACHT and TPR domain protein [Aspergillus ellipticus CBS 707.79]